jgi:hypothetical protein
LEVAASALARSASMGGGPGSDGGAEVGNKGRSMRGPRSSSSILVSRGNTLPLAPKMPAVQTKVFFPYGNVLLVGVGDAVPSAWPMAARTDARMVTPWVPAASAFRSPWVGFLSEVASTPVHVKVHLGHRVGFGGLMTNN